MLKDNKVPGTSAETRAVEAPSWGARSAAGFLGEARCLFGPGGIEQEEILEKKKRKQGYSAAI